MSPRFSANLSMLFREHAFLDRFEAARACGFEAVECLFPYDWPAAEIRRRLNGCGLRQVLFNLPPGAWGKGERGLACLPGREGEFRDGLARALDYAEALRCTRLHCMAGIPGDTDAEHVEATYRENLGHAARQCREAGVTLTIEPLNRTDVPGYHLSDFGQALALIEELAADGAAPALQFDIYHCARIHSDVPQWLRRAHKHIAHLQIAGVPDRHEPNLGTLDLRAIFETLGELDLDCWIGCEYHPAGRTEEGLGWIEGVKTYARQAEG